MDLGLRDRTVLVTGGSSGVGLATVGLLLDEGANVVTCARDGDRLAAAVEPLADRHPGRLLARVADVTDQAAVDALVAACADRFGGLDGLVCNAGRSRPGTVATLTDADWRDEMDLKLFSVLHPVRAAGKLLAASGQGAVVVVGAVLARQPEPHLVATGTARAAQLHLTRALARELAPVRVTGVLLGLIDSGQWRRRWEALDDGSTFDDYAAGIAADRGVGLGRLGGADEVAPTIALLLSPRSGYTTGTAVEIDGGVGRYV